MTNFTNQRLLKAYQTYLVQHKQLCSPINKGFERGIFKLNKLLLYDVGYVKIKCNLRFFPPFNLSVIFLFAETHGRPRQEGHVLPVLQARPGVAAVAAGANGVLLRRIHQVQGRHKQSKRRRRLAETQACAGKS